MMSTIVLIILLASVLSSAFSLSIEEQFCGGIDCVIEDYDFFTQQFIDLTKENSTVSTAEYGEFTTVVAVDNAAKNNFIFFSSDNSPLNCSSSRALLYEYESSDPLPLSNVALAQFEVSSCLANFSTVISSVDLQKNLHFILAVHDDIASATASLGVRISTAIIPGTRPNHLWTSSPNTNVENAIVVGLEVQIGELPMILPGCLETGAGLNLQLLQADGVASPQCKFTPDSVVVDTVGGTVVMEKGLTQSEYWMCASSVTFPNSILTFLITVVPDFDGCQYYEHHSYSPYVFNVLIQYIITQGPFGLVLQQTTTTMDV